MNESGLSRRVFYERATFAILTVIGAAAAMPALSYLLVMPKPHRPSDLVEAIDLKDLADGVPEEVVFRRNKRDGWKITSEKQSAWVVKQGESAVIAYVPQCTHLGCAFHWDEPKKTFVCPCHTSSFSIDGKVLEGPAPRALDRYKTEIRDGKLLIGEPRKG